MSVIIFNRYEMGHCISCGDHKREPPYPDEDGEWVKFDEVVEVVKLSAFQINQVLKNMNSNDQRLDFLSESFAGICRECGEITDSCYCMYDD